MSRFIFSSTIRSRRGSSALKNSFGGKALRFRPDGLVAGRACVARLHPRQLPDHPVGGLDQAVGGGVHLRRFVEDLPGFGEEPFRADLAAVAVQEVVAQSPGDFIQLVGFGLGGVMLPQLDPGMRLVAPLGQEAERGAIRLGGQHRAGRKVDADADDIRGIDAALFEHSRDGVLEHLDIVVGVLERPVGFETNVALW